MTRAAWALDLQADRMMLNDGSQEVFDLPLSPSILAARHWPQSLPGPLQLERAIDDLENALQQAGLRHVERGALQVSDSVRQLLPDIEGAAAELSRDDIEARFSRMVERSATRRPGSLGSVAESESAAALLMLREILHHLGFDAVATRPPSAPA